MSHGVLHASGGIYRYAGEAFPASHVSLRNIGWDNFVIIELCSSGQGSSGQGSSGRVRSGRARSSAPSGELDYRAAHTMLHEQAIYQQDAEQYQVERLDFENHKAYVRKVEPDYFTTALTLPRGHRARNPCGTAGGGGDPRSSGPPSRSP